MTEKHRLAQQKRRERERLAVATEEARAEVEHGIQPFKVDWDRLLLNDDTMDAVEYFYGTCFFTQDEAAEGRRGRSKVYKRFPWAHRPDVQRVVRYKHTHSGFFRMLGSRKIMKTWMEVGRLSLLGLRHEGRMILLGSTKEERADMNLQRIIFVLSTLITADTNAVQPDRIRFIKRAENRFDFGNGTVYLAVTMNPNDLTQVTASDIWLDEFTKLGVGGIPDDTLKRQFIAIGLPATQHAVGDVGPEAGGMSLSGTCEGEELMWRMMFPDDDARARLIAPHEDPKNEQGLRCPERGLQIWGEGDVHNILWYYFADPGKVPGSPWYVKERAKWHGNEDGWNREMEIWPVGISELRITPEYKEGLHAHSLEELSEMYDPRIPLVMGWDIGARYQAVTVTQRLRSGRILVFMTLFEDNRNVEAFARQAVGVVKAEFPQAMALHVGDPRTLATSTGTAYGDFSEILLRAGVSCMPAPAQGLQAKVALLKRVLSDYIDGSPKVLIAKETSRPLALALREKYVYDKNGMKPMRDGITEHAVDSFIFTLLQHEHLMSADEDEWPEAGVHDVYAHVDDFEPQRPRHKWGKPHYAAERQGVPLL